MTEYDPVFAVRVRDLTMAGLRDAEIARILCISVTTMQNWAERYPDFAYAWKDGKLQADVKVVGALFRRACGMKITRMKETPAGMIREVIEQPPDTSACIFWLVNRQPENWKAKIDQDTGNSGRIVGEEITEIEAARRIAYTLSKALNDVENQ